MDYINLDKTALLLGVEMEQYYQAKELFQKDMKLAIKKYLGYEYDEQTEIQYFTDFWYYYLADYSKNFFHNFGSINYTKNIKNFLEKNNIETNYIDFDSFQSKEKIYSEVLFDILLSEVKYNLKDKDLDIFGINVGFNSNIYYILPKSILKELKTMTSSYAIFDFEKLEEIYGEIYRINDEIENISSIKAGDYVEKNKNDGKYITLYNNLVRKNYIIDKIDEKYLELVL